MTTHSIETMADSIQDVELILSQLTTDEKIDLLSGMMYVRTTQLEFCLTHFRT